MSAHQVLTTGFRSMTSFVSKVTQSEEDLAPILEGAEFLVEDPVFTEDLVAARASLRRMLRQLELVTV